MHLKLYHPLAGGSNLWPLGHMALMVAVHVVQYISDDNIASQCQKVGQLCQSLIEVRVTRHQQKFSILENFTFVLIKDPMSKRHSKSTSVVLENYSHQ